MKRTVRFLSGLALIASFVLPASPAVADNNPCKGDGTPNKCRPPCEANVDEGDLRNGIAPSIYWTC